MEGDRFRETDTGAAGRTDRGSRIDAPELDRQEDKRQDWYLGDKTERNTQRRISWAHGQTKNSRQRMDTQSLLRTDTAAAQAPMVGRGWRA